MKFLPSKGPLVLVPAASLPVGRLELEPNPLFEQGAPREERSLGAIELDRRALPVGLGRVHADEPYGVLAASADHLDGVPVDYVGDEHPFGRRGGGPGGSGAGCRERDSC